MLEEVQAWQDRPLDPIYPVVFLDAIVVKVRDNHVVRNKAAYLAVGVDLDGDQARAGHLGASQRGGEVLGRGLAELRNRGVRDILIVCCDGLTGFPEAIEATWPAATVQTCVVHLIRAAMRFVSYDDRKAVAAGAAARSTPPRPPRTPPRPR